MTNIKNWKGENRQCKLCHIFIPHLGFLNQLFQIFVFTLYIIKNCNYFIHLSIVNVVILSSLYFNSCVRVHVLPFIFDYVIMCKILSLCLRWFRFFVVTHIYIIASSNPHSCCHHSFVSSNYRVSVNMGVLSL